MEEHSQSPENTPRLDIDAREDLVPSHKPAASLPGVLRRRSDLWINRGAEAIRAAVPKRDGNRNNRGDKRVDDVEVSVREDRFTMIQ